MPRKSARKESLLGDDDDAGGFGGFGGKGELSFNVNESYAKRFEHNKQREELHRLQARHPELATRLGAKARVTDAGDGSGEDESSSEEEDLGEIPEETEEAILDTLLRIRRKDPVIYQSDVHFFQRGDDDDGSDGDGDTAGVASNKASTAAAAAAPKQKKLYLKDVLARQALEHGAEVSSSDEEGGGGGGRADSRPPKAYDTEQESLRQAFLSAATEADGDGGSGDGELVAGVMRRRHPKADAGEDDGAEGGDAGAGGGGGALGRAKQLEKLAGKVFREDDDGDAFLRQYILNKGWVDKSEVGYVPSYDEVVASDVDDDEDEQQYEQAERFEAAYNFRFEEPGGVAIQSHPRVVEGSVRKPDERRKRQREEKKQRMAEAEEARRDEVKRLKNLKKKEIEQRMALLQKVAGAAAPGGKTIDQLLEGDFDPDEWDKHMASAFDEDYYNAQDEELDKMLLDDPELREAREAGLAAELDDESDEFGDDDDVAVVEGPRGDVGDGGGDGDDSGGDARRGKSGRKVVPGTFKDLHRRLVQLTREEAEAEANGGDGSGRSAEEAAKQRAEVQRLLEEYYTLDYEDAIGGLRTRFRYKDVEPLSFGLSADEILARSDKELNQVAGLKRLAPYRDDAAKLRPNYKALQELKRSAPDALRKPGRKHAPHKKYPQQPREGQPGRPAGGGDAWRPRTASPSNKKDKDREVEGEKDKRDKKEKKSKDEKEAKEKKHKRETDPEGENGASAAGKAAGGVGEKPAKRFKPAPMHEADAKAVRLASYAKLELPGKSAKTDKGHKPAGKPGGSGGLPKQGAAGGSGGASGGMDPSGPQLTKAQRKNLKRTQKRAAQKGA